MQFSHRLAPTAALALLLLGATACDSSVTGTGTSLHSARARWARSKPVYYTATMYRSCECLPEMAGPVTVAVRNDSVVSRYYVYSGDAVDSRYDSTFPAVEGLFDIIDAAIRAGTRPLHVRYDRELGYPTFIDMGDHSIDAGQKYSVSLFTSR